MPKNYIEINDDLFEFLKTNFAEDSQEILDLLYGLKDTLDNLESKILEQSAVFVKSRDFDSSNKYNQVASDVYNISQNIDKYSVNLKINKNDEPDSLDDDEELVLVLDDELDSLDDLDDAEELDINEFMPDGINFIDYPISLETRTDFTNFKPVAFAFQGEIKEVSSWKEMLMKTCNILCIFNKALMLNFPDNPGMNGRTRKYFSYSPIGFLKPRKIDKTKLYIETNFSANAIIKLIKILLKQYNIPISEFKVFLRSKGI